MNRVAIVHAELRSPFGDREQTWRRLCNGETAMAEVSRFSVEPYPTRRAATIAGLDPAASGSRLDSLLQLLLDGLPSLPFGTELLLASIKGRIDLIRPGMAGDSTAMQRLEPQSLLEDLRDRLQLAQGENVHAACASSTIAIGQAGARIRSGQSAAVLVLAADLVSELVFSGFSALKGLSTRACRPFDQRRDGLLLGEGAAALLLMTPQRAAAAGLPVLAELVGWGSAGDAHHITAPARDGAGLLAAMEQALRLAGAQSEEICAINAHGTGTLYNDAMELTAFGRLFGDRSLPLNSLKGALGHSLGAAGAIEAVLGVAALQHGCLSPTWGCEQPEETALQLSTAAQEFGPGLLLSTNSGFGGINAALLLQGGEQ
ncbi:beta-ketoacyl synthase [Geothermobacter hydrogeniphilus]|uniref:Beta-ketoacyl synthase n=1 Tax=Geothermobacter hydrogeniphilus TaxID=1969733 RepID=A0A2K2HBJ8_9BACT|nr:beta-ketoacyl synthase N-terminal-like domain-containing protein [Geothermobacter hydrogeniphilus]PNU20637.1 beta-ketoacyl synthase [Geothermobacter hydrogeniphilus]